MAQFRLDWLEQKRADWYIVTATDLSTGQKQTSVSINEMDKKTGKPAWKDWANMKAGDVLEGKLWQSQKGGWYLFPSQEDENANGVVVRSPNANFRANGATKGNQIAKAQQVKKENINEAMAQKEESVKQASTFRDATLLTVAELGSGAGDEQMRETWLRWRQFLLEQWSLPF